MGPLEGIRVVEMAGLAPVPYAGMILADFGAEVIRVDRSPTAGSRPDPTRDYLARGKRSIGINLKDPRGLDMVLRLLDRAGTEDQRRETGCLHELPGQLDHVGHQEFFVRSPDREFALCGAVLSQNTAGAAFRDIQFTANTINAGPAASGA